MNPQENIILFNSPALETAVLGALILEHEQFDTVAGILTPETFCDKIHQTIYAEMLRADQTGESFDLYTLSLVPALRSQRAYLAQLTNGVGSAVQVIEHARRLKALEIRRRMVAYAEELRARASANDFDTDELLTWSNNQLDTLRNGAISGNLPRSMREIMADTLAEIERRQQESAQGQPAGITTGLQKLDQMTGGWRGGQLIVVAGRPGMGKSAAMLHFANAAAKEDRPVVIFSLEMSDRSLCERLTVGESGVPSDHIRQGRIASSEWQQIEQAASTLSNLPIWVDDTAGISMRTLCAKAKQMHRQGRCEMVMIDYVGLLDTSTGNRNSIREQEIARITRAAKILAKDLDIPVFLLSQLNRNVETRPDKTPQLSDLRESGSVEQDADVVILLYRPSYYDIREIDGGRYGTISTDGLTEFIVAKQRDGATPTVLARCNESLTTFADYDSGSSVEATNSQPF